MQVPQPSRGFEWTQAPWGPALRCVPLAAAAPHLFTIANLQLRDDEREWEALAAAMGVQRNRLLLIHQVHGAAVAVARTGDAEPWNRPEADIVVSDDPEAAIAVRVADCAPILLADTRTGAVGAVHAGWRGAVQSAAVAGVRAMEAELGSRAEELIAAIGPCLGACCGEVGPEVVAAFLDGGHAPAALGRWFGPGRGDRRYLDLWRTNADQLETAGIRPENIHVAGLCTRTHTRVMHSYRASGPAAGRMTGVIRAVRR